MIFLESSLFVAEKFAGVSKPVILIFEMILILMEESTRTVRGTLLTKI